MSDELEDIIVSLPSFNLDEGISSLYYSCVDDCEDSIDSSDTIQSEESIESSFSQLELLMDELVFEESPIAGAPKLSINPFN